MINETLKVGIIGVGRFGSRHLSKWLAMDNIEVIGFNDKNSEICQKLEKEQDLNYYSLNDLIAICDILDIVVPISQHYIIAKQCLEAGKHIFIEKSFAQTLEQAEELAELASQKGVKVGLGHIERYNPVLIQLKDQLKTTPKKLLAFRQGPYIPGNGIDVSIVLELMIHDIDLITHFIPYPIDTVYATGENPYTNNSDRATAIIKFTNGSEAILFASRAEEKRRREILCTDGDFEYKADLMNRTLSSSKNDKVLEFEFSDAMMDELNTFVEAVRQNKDYPINAQTGVKTVKIAEMINSAMS